MKNIRLHMISIGIAGSIGAGKTTFAKALNASLNNSTLIHGDVIMKAVLYDSSQIIENSLSCIHSSTKSHMSMINFYETPEKAQKTLEVISPIMNARIIVMLESQKKCASFCIVEWNLLSTLSIWNTLDYRIFIYASSKIRLDRLLQRDESEKKHDKKILLRMQNLNDNILPLNAVIIKNEGSIEGLYKQAECVSKKLKTLIYQNTEY